MIYVDNAFIQNLLLWMIGKTEVRDYGCWEWIHPVSVVNIDYPYGLVNIKSKTYLAHRVSACLFLGLNIKDSKTFICHKCDNPRCWNPSHLFLGDHNDNMQDMISKGRKPRGLDTNRTHLTEENIKEIRRLRENGFTCQSIGDKFGICRQAVSRIARKQRRSEVE